MGNLHSVHKALQHVTNDNVIITADADKIAKADRIVFPGQGAARDCMSELHKRELVDVVKEVSTTKPFLGVCMGMQVLMDHSVEGGGIDCIGLYKGRVEFFKEHIKDMSKQFQKDSLKNEYILGLHPQISIEDPYSLKVRQEIIQVFNDEQIDFDSRQTNVELDL